MLWHSVVGSGFRNPSGDALSDVSCRATEKHKLLLCYARMGDVLAEGVEIGGCRLVEQQTFFGGFVADPIENLKVCINSDDSDLRHDSHEAFLVVLVWHFVAFLPRRTFLGTEWIL